jgi:hypothetical protein
MSSSNAPGQIPSSAAAFFQEYDPARLEMDHHAELIYERILAYGNRIEVRWLLDTCGRERVRGWVEQTGVRRLPWRRLHLWCFVFSLSMPEKPRRIWPY